MIKRTLYFGNPAHLKKHNDQLMVRVKDKPETLIPIEDIGLVVLDHPQVTITHGLGNALIENNAAVLWCNDKHMPNGLILPMSANHTYTEKLRYQLNSSEPLRKSLWKQTVMAKIDNQAAVLEKMGANSAPLRRWSKEVKSGDPENVEARAASYYWGKYFEYLDLWIVRHRFGAPPNNALNYGYAILRAIVARALVGSGCLPAVGIHHHNKYNPFCLADDVMEPYRPFVDYYAMQQFTMGGLPPEKLDKNWKATLLKVPVIDTKIDGKKSPLMHSAQRSSSSLMACYEGSSRKLLYPDLT
jgi:CRISPR-associated protein Cas1